MPVLVFGAGGEARNAEIGELQGVGFRVVHHVGRFDVAMHDAFAVRVAERVGGAGDDRHHFLRLQQVALLGERYQVAALQELHGDEAVVVLLARVVDGDDVGVRELARGLRLAEEALLHPGDLVGLELLRQRQRLDRHLAPDLRVLAEIDHAHRALAELLLDLEAAELRLLADAELQRAARVRAAAEDHRLGELLGARDLLADIAELGVEGVDVAEHRLGLVELALALEIEAEVVEVVGERLGHRHLPELVPGEVELALSLVGEAEHAVRLRRALVGLDLGALGDDEALR